MFKKILIANRGEIACRVIKTAHSLGIKTVAVYSDADARALHVRSADEAVRIGAAPSRDSYLKGDVIIAAAKATGAEAIHPGYGFLSENEEFARACEKAGIVFIGPTPDAINTMGLKDRAKAIMEKAGVPIVPGYQGDDQTPVFLQKQADKIGYPVLIKAVAGGGGKGMRLVEKSTDFIEALASCQREAQSSFNNAHVLIEKYITKPRHIEVQVFGDSHGNAVYLFERDCSLQRRHQKVVEEAPAPGLSEKTRAAMGEAAVKAAKAIKYRGAGTIEFIVDVSKGIDKAQFYFMEMNTRLQVEHPVTEMITGQDLVAWQLRVANGEKLPLAQKDLSITGHAFEVRLYAEDPASNFLPQIGRLTRFRKPTGDHVRVDTGVAEGDEVSIHYDPMIAKLIVWDKDRVAAIAKMAAALADTAIAGLRTNQEFLHNIFMQKDFAAGDVDTGFIARHEKDLLPPSYSRPGTAELALAAIWSLAAPAEKPSPDPWSNRDNWRLNGVLTKTVAFLNRDEPVEIAVTAAGRDFTLAVGEEKIKASFVSFNDGVLTITVNGSALSGIVAAHGNDLTIFHAGRVVSLRRHMPGALNTEKGEGRILSPMPGRIIAVMVGKGDEVVLNQPLLVMEAMKMEMTIRAGCAGLVDELPFGVNDQVQDGVLLIAIKARDAA